MRRRRIGSRRHVVAAGGDFLIADGGRIAGLLSLLLKPFCVFLPILIFSSSLFSPFALFPLLESRSSIERYGQVWEGQRAEDAQDRCLSYLG